MNIPNIWATNVSAPRSHTHRLQPLFGKKHQSSRSVTANPDGPDKILVTTFRESLSDGGTGRMIINFLNGLPREAFTQDLVTLSDTSHYQHEVPGYIQSHVLEIPYLRERAAAFFAVLPLARHLKRTRPDILVVHSARANFIALLAVILSRSRTKVVIVQHMHHSPLVRLPFRFFKGWLYRRFARALYRRADHFVGVSDGVADNIRNIFGVPERKITTIFNPVVREELFAQARAPLDHPWFAGGQTPVVLAVGRLVEIKDFITLIRAFAKVRSRIDSRLVILGEGPEEKKLREEVKSLGLNDSVQFLGFEANPYRYMSRAAVLVLSSLSEALPTVLIEALACGCPVVSTDCPTGPREILEGGKWGRLVTVARPDELAGAILSTLTAEIGANKSRRADSFSVARSVASYTKLFKKLLDHDSQQKRPMSAGL